MGDGSTASYRWEKKRVFTHEEVQNAIKNATTSLQADVKAATVANKFLEHRNQTLDDNNQKLALEMAKANKLIVEQASMLKSQGQILKEYRRVYGHVVDFRRADQLGPFAPGDEVGG